MEKIDLKSYMQNTAVVCFFGNYEAACKIVGNKIKMISTGEFMEDEYVASIYKIRFGKNLSDPNATDEEVEKLKKDLLGEVYVLVAIDEFAGEFIIEETAHSFAEAVSIFEKKYAGPGNTFLAIARRSKPSALEQDFTGHVRISYPNMQQA